jgi:hypothetical protein
MNVTATAMANKYFPVMEFIAFSLPVNQRQAQLARAWGT